MNAVAQLAPEVGVARACVVMDVNRSARYRRRVSGILCRLELVRLLATPKEPT